MTARQRDDKGGRTGTTLPLWEPSYTKTICSLTNARVCAR